MTPGSPAAELVERTCRDQGLPELVSDTTALAKVAAILKSTKPLFEPPPG
ncbi:MAG TPA: hypothetical protein VMZ51_07835 [Acidimicrobiales bacterium]|nr:hypothetical protein [Acidimicrobiales bacterium]